MLLIKDACFSYPEKSLSVAVTSGSLSLKALLICARNAANENGLT